MVNHLTLPLCCDGPKGVKILIFGRQMETLLQWRGDGKSRDVNPTPADDRKESFDAQI